MRTLAGIIAGLVLFLVGVIWYGVAQADVGNYSWTTIILVNTMMNSLLLCILGWTAASILWSMRD